MNCANLQYIPPSFITIELCEIAVCKSGKTLQFVPSSILNKQLCLLAVFENFMALEFVPTSILDEDICMAAFSKFDVDYQMSANKSKCIEIFEKIGKIIKSESSCIFAIGKFHGIYEYIDDEFKTDNVYKII